MSAGAVKVKQVPWMLRLLLSPLVALFACAHPEAFLEADDYYQHDYDGSYYDADSQEKAIGDMSPEEVDLLNQPKHRIMVLDFWNNTPIQDSKLGKLAADEFRRALYQGDEVILPPEAQGKNTTEAFVSGDRVRVAELVQEGKQAGVSLAALGRISKLTFRQQGDDVGLLRQRQSLASAEMELKVFDLRSGREIMASGESATAQASAVVALEKEDMEAKEFRRELSQRAFQKVAMNLSRKLEDALEKMTWEGRVAKIIGHQYYVNAGRESGLLLGDVLKVMSPGDDIYDPTTGAFLGRTEGQLKGTLEVVDFIGDDAAVTRLHSGANIRESDIVRLY